MESVGIVFTKDNKHTHKKNPPSLPHEDSEPEANPCWSLDPGLSGLQTMRKCFCFLSHPVCGALLWQLK